MEETQQPSSGRTAPRQAGPDASAEDAAHWLAALVNSSDDAIISKTLDGVITSWNTAAQQIYGYSAEEIIGQSVSLLIPPERLDEFNEIMRRLRQGEYIDHLETARVRRDGRRIDVSLTISPIIDAQSQIIGASTIARDITARKQAEEALRRAQDELEAKVAERTRELAVRNQQLQAEITEREQAEQELQEAHRRIETILESITDAFFALDREWRYTYLNEQALGRIGGAKGEALTREELMGKNCWEEFPETVGTMFDQELHRALGEQRTVEFESYSPPTDSWVGVHVYPSEEGLSVYVQDITERMKAEEQLAYHARLLEHTEDAVLASNEHAVLTVWNKGAEQMFGWTAEEVLGRKVYDVLPYREYSDEQLAEALRRLAEMGRRRTEATWYRKDGAPVYAEALTIALRGEQGPITGYLSIIRDVSERKRAEEALQEAGRRTETILESITEAFFALDREWRFTYINQRSLNRARSVTGAELAREDVLGKNCWELFPESVGTALDRELHTALREQKTVNFEMYQAATDHWLEVHAYPSEEGLSAFSQDITARKRAEQDRQRLLEQLISAQEDERGRLARELHDSLGQQLTALHLGLKVVQIRDDATAGVADAIQQLRELALRIDDELDRLTLAMRPPALENLGLAEALRVLVKEWSATSHIPVDLHTSHLDHERPPATLETTIYRIVQEALTNVLKHAQATRVSLVVERRGAEVQTIIEDDGRGFDLDVLRHEPGAGRQLGLRGMQERAALAGGRLDIETAVGAGTTIYVHIPLRPEEGEGGSAAHDRSK